MCHRLEFKIPARRTHQVDGGPPPIMEGITTIPQGRQLTIQVAPKLGARFNRVVLELQQPPPTSTQRSTKRRTR